MTALPDALTALVTVVAIDVTLAGDNAVVVGLAAAALPPQQRHRALLAGIVAAAVLRVLFALVTVKMLGIVGLPLAGGLLLLWVGWKLWREIGRPPGTAGTTGSDDATGFGRAVIRIVLADLSMSLDNVLAVAGAARDHVVVMVIGLALSVALMGLAANLVAGLLQRHRWLAYCGLLLVLWVAVTMIRDGSHQIVMAGS
jgi:YjbE family integral membrane protein